MTQPSAADVALQVVQQAITILANWAGVKLPPECQCSKDYPAVQLVKQDILPWGDGNQPQALRVLFDWVKLDRGHAKEYYWPTRAIANEKPLIPYPQTEKPDLEQLRREIRDTLRTINGQNWQNLSLLTLIIEKFGSCISFSEDNVALVDLVRSTAAVAAALPQYSNLEQYRDLNIHLIAGNISGIQNFIYTISSDGALKSLRARSFYLELLTEAIVHQLLKSLKLPRINVVYAGGGNFYVLASSDAAKVEQELKKIRELFNKWLQNQFKGQLFLAIDFLAVPTIALKTREIANYWTDVTKKLADWKLRKFQSNIAEFIKPKPSYQPCQVCHRDDLPSSSLKPLNHSEPDSSPACWMCRSMFKLGEKLFGVKAIICSNRSNIKSLADRLTLPKVYYYFFKEWESALAAVQEDETILTINDWQLEHYQHKNTVPLLLGNYGQRIKEEPNRSEERFIRAEEMAERAKGISRVGYLRMDVDRLGRIFAEGLGEKQTLPRIAGLSRMMSYFFKVYLNSLAENRQDNLPKTAKCLTGDSDPSPRPNLLFIYAGGDDLFISGAWNEVVEFAFNIYQCFRAYTGRNPDITLSGGVSINDVKFPLYQAANESGAAEKAAKGNGKDSLGLFGGTFKWEEWLGIEDIKVINKEDREYLDDENKPDENNPNKGQPKLWGIFPLVEQLNSQLDVNYSRSFVRNLLLTAQLQEQMLKKIKDEFSRQQKLKKIEDEFLKQHEDLQRDIRYYLHLPKIAYTLARLPSYVREHKDFDDVRTSLKNPYNAPYFRAIATWIELLNR